MATPATGLCMLMPMDTKIESVAILNLKPSWLDVVTSVFDGTGNLKCIGTILEIKKIFLLKPIPVRDWNTSHNGT